MHDIIACMEMDGKCDSKTQFYIQFRFFWSFSSTFGFEVSKKEKCKQINIRYGYHKTEIQC
jgi:hypothetical protein